MWLVPQERTSRINTLSEIRWRPGQRVRHRGAQCPRHAQEPHLPEGLRE